MGNRFENLRAEPLTERHYPLLMARGAKVTTFAKIGQQVFVTTILALHPRKAEMQITALQIAIDDIGDIGSPETIALCVTVLPVHLQLLKVILYAAKIAAGLKISGPANASVLMVEG